MAAAATLVFNANPVVPATVLATVKGIDVVADKVGNLVGGIDRHALEAADRAVAAEESRERAAEEEAAAAVVAKRQALYLRGYRNIAVIKENVAAQAEAEAAALASLAEKFKARARQRWVGARALHPDPGAVAQQPPPICSARATRAARARREAPRCAAGCQGARGGGGGGTGRRSGGGERREKKKGGGVAQCARAQRDGSGGGRRRQMQPRARQWRRLKRRLRARRASVPRLPT